MASSAQRLLKITQRQPLGGAQNSKKTLRKSYESSLKLCMIIRSSYFDLLFLRANYFKAHAVSNYAAATVFGNY